MRKSADVTHLTSVLRRRAAHHVVAPPAHDKDHRRNVMSVFLHYHVPLLNKAASSVPHTAGSRY